MKYHNFIGKNHNIYEKVFNVTGISHGVYAAVKADKQQYINACSLYV